jgi:hypothetical protein
MLKCAPPDDGLYLFRLNAVLLEYLGDILRNFDLVPRRRNIVCDLRRVVLPVLSDSEIEDQLATGRVLYQKAMRGVAGKCPEVRNLGGHEPLEMGWPKVDWINKSDSNSLPLGDFQ